MSGLSALEEKIADVGAKLADLLEKSDLSPWQSDCIKSSMVYRNASTGKPYRGQNIILLMIESFTMGYRIPLFVGFQQAKELGLTMIKGSKSCPVIFPVLVKKTDEEAGDGDEDASEGKSVIRGWRWANVFNISCFVDDDTRKSLIAKYDSVLNVEASCPEIVLKLQEVFKPNIVIDNNSYPCYLIKEDKISLPDIHHFRDDASYAAAFIHELAHWTGHSTRLNRPLNHFSQETKEAYAYEELVAEMASAILCAEFGIPYSLEKHASYIKGWSKHLRSERNSFFSALKEAARVSRYLNLDQSK